MSYCIKLYYIILCYIISYYIILSYIILYYIILNYIVYMYRKDQWTMAVAGDILNTPLQVMHCT